MLLNGNPSVLGGDQVFEDRQDAFPVMIYTVQFSPEGALKILCFQPLVGNAPGNVDIFAEGAERVSAEEEAVKEGRLSMRSQRIEIFSGRHDALPGETPL